jgi:integrase
LALRRRYLKAQKAAGLRPLRFHDLRHTFGSLAINPASICRCSTGRDAHSATTERYLRHKFHAAEAELLDGAFAPTRTVARR